MSTYLRKTLHAYFLYLTVPLFYSIFRFEEK